MAEGRSKALWQHTSRVLCILANAFRDPKQKQPFSPDVFNPHAPATPNRGPVLDTVNVKDLRKTLLGALKAGR